MVFNENEGRIRTYISEGLRQVRGRPITPKKKELEALSLTGILPPRRSTDIRSSIKRNKSRRKSPNKNSPFTKTPLPNRHDDSDFDIDEIPITKLDFSNIDVSEPEEGEGGARVRKGTKRKREKTTEC